MKRIFSLFSAVLLFLSLCSCGITAADQPNLLRELSYSSTSAKDLIQLIMPAEYIKQFSQNYDLKTNGKSFDHLYERNDAKGSLGIFRLNKPKAYAFVAFDVNGHPTDGMYLTHFFDPSAFSGITKGKSTLDDVKKVDPNILPIDRGDSGSESFHWLSNGEYIHFIFNKSGTVTEISTGTSSVFSRLTESDLAYLKTL